MGIRVLYFLSAIILTSLMAQAGGVVMGTPSWQTFQNAQCQATRSCGLRAFRLRIRPLELRLEGGEPSFGTQMVAWFQARSPREIFDFGLVQKVRGCVFESRLVNGRIKKSLNASRELFREYVPFVHRQWQIDSSTLDPMVFSGLHLGEDRHAFQRWNRQPFAAKKSSEKTIKQGLPQHATVYVKDIPTAAMLVEKDGPIARNVSLQFETCIYHSEDIPIESHADDLGFADPIHCFRWDHSYVFDFAQGKFTPRNEIDPFCR